jgi:hypothetical protein
MSRLGKVVAFLAAVEQENHDNESFTAESVIFCRAKFGKIRKNHGLQCVYCMKAPNFEAKTQIDCKNLAKSCYNRDVAILQGVQSATRKVME